MFSERMAVEANLRREKLNREAWEDRLLRPYRRKPRWQVWLCLRLGAWLVTRGTALQQRAELTFSDYRPHSRMEQAS